MYETDAGPAATVTALWRYPVKSLQGVRVDELDLRAHGARGDRRWAIVRDGKPLSAKRVPQLLLASVGEVDDDVVITLPDGTQTGSADPDVDALLARWLDAPARLVRHPQAPWVDAAPIHLLTTASLVTMRTEHSGDWDPRRFRPNLLVDVPRRGVIEDAWVGQRMRVGAAHLSVRMRTVRCAMTGHPQPELCEDRNVLSTLARVNDISLGVYADVAVPGVVRVGDGVTVFDGRSASTETAPARRG